MKTFTLLLALLFIAGITSAETYTMVESGDSFWGLLDPDTALGRTIYRSGDTIIITEISPPVSNPPLDDYFRGPHNEIGVNLAQAATPADFYASCIGCPEFLNHRIYNIPIRGRLTGGSRNEFIRELRNLTMKRMKSPYRDLYEPPVQPRVQPFWRGDVVHLWIWGTGGKATINGIEWPCFFLANEVNCSSIGGDPLFPWELRAIIESVIGGAKFYIYLNFAYAGAWEFWLEIPNVYVWSGVGASELCYLIEDGDLACYMWDGYDIGECYFVEPMGHQAMCLKMHDTNNDYNPFPWDRNGDYYVYQSEACLTLTERCPYNSSSYTGGDRRLYGPYADVNPRGGDNITVEIMPNPFNPVAWIGFELPRDMRVEIIVFNILGQKVATVVDAPLPAGAHRFKFDGSHLTSGIYFVRGSFDGAPPVTKKMSLVK